MLRCHFCWTLMWKAMESFKNSKRKNLQNIWLPLWLPTAPRHCAHRLSSYIFQRIEDQLHFQPSVFGLMDRGCGNVGVRWWATSWGGQQCDPRGNRVSPELPLWSSQWREQSCDGTGLPGDSPETAPGWLEQGVLGQGKQSAPRKVTANPGNQEGMEPWWCHGNAHGGVGNHGEIVTHLKGPSGF